MTLAYSSGVEYALLCLAIRQFLGGVSGRMCEIFLFSILLIIKTFVKRIVQKLLGS